MKLSDFDYELPAERIAQWPLNERDASRMLILGRTTGEWEDRQFREFSELLHGNELVVLNNARVIPARLWGRRKGINAQPAAREKRLQLVHLSSRVEVLLLKRLGEGEWEALVRPGRKIPTGETIIFGDGDLEAEVTGRAGYGLRRLRFSAAGDISESLVRLGHIPLPPYIKREDDAIDRERYQTVFSRQGSAVAAPTAGLHFTPRILQRLRERGIEIAEITLDVGLGTFEPVRTENIEDHKIHSESYEIPEAAAQAIARARRERRPVLAVGTTVVRALEDAAEKFAMRQSGMTRRDSEAGLEAGHAEAEILLYPGKEFRIVDQLLTNFHLPRSSLLALVAGFAGRENILHAYRHAVTAGYRFYSYGDCMWIR